MRPLLGWHQLPNAICVIRVVAVFTALIVIGHTWNQEGRWSPIWFVVIVIAALTDRLDGFLAKRYGWTSTLGAFLDQITDKMVTLALFAFVSLVGAFPILALAAIVLRELFVTGLRIVANLEAIRIPSSEAGRFKTFVQQVAVLPIFLHWAFPDGGPWGQTWAQVGVWAAWLAFWIVMAGFGRRGFALLTRVYTLRRVRADGVEEASRVDLILVYLTILLIAVPATIAGPAVVLTITLGTGLTYFSAYLWARRESRRADRPKRAAGGPWQVAIVAVASLALAGGFTLVLRAWPTQFVMWAAIGVLSALWTFLLSVSYATEPGRSSAGY